jgi:hypothetical protein
MLFLVLGQKYHEAWIKENVWAWVISKEPTAFGRPLLAGKVATAAQIEDLVFYNKRWMVVHAMTYQLTAVCAERAPRAREFELSQREGEERPCLP